MSERIPRFRLGIHVVTAAAIYDSGAPHGVVPVARRLGSRR